jgi:hypothetical protein
LKAVQKMIQKHGGEAGAKKVGGQPYATYALNEIPRHDERYLNETITTGGAVDIGRVLSRTRLLSMNLMHRSRGTRIRRAEGTKAEGDISARNFVDPSFRGGIGTDQNPVAPYARGCIQAAVDYLR